MKPILHIEDLRVEARLPDGEVNPKPLVESVSLTLEPGEVLGLIGETGAGKTTTGLAALGYTRPGCTITGGRIIFDGTDLRSLTPEQIRQIRGRRIGYIAQSAAASFNPAWRLNMQVGETPVRHGLMSWPEARKRSAEVFRELNLPTPETFGEWFPHQVSGGQLQRAMAAMAISCNPDILVLDEPTTALDVTTQIEVLASLRNLIREHRTAALYISHDLAVVAQVADRILVLRDGQMVEEGPANDIVVNPQQPYTRELISVRASDTTVPFRPTVEPSDQGPVLMLNDVTASYRTRARVVRGVSLEINRAETVAVVGESGSGKSSLARVICGLLPPEAGTVQFRGQPLPRKLSQRSRDELRRIQMVYQMPDVALNPRHTVEKVIGRPLNFYANGNAGNVPARVVELLEMVDLSGTLIKRHPEELSGGQKQRVCIARALAAEPDLMICDEITSSLDPLVADGILRLLQRIQNEMGLAFLFITHDLGLVRRVANRVAVMFEGEMVAEGSVEKVFSPPFHPYTELLLSSVPELRTGWLDEVLAKRAGAPAA